MFRGCGDWIWNQRPLGYEGKSSDHGHQDEPSQTNDDKALPNHLVGPFWFISVGLLHSRFIGLDGGNRFRSGFAAGRDSNPCLRSATRFRNLDVMFRGADSTPLRTGLKSNASGSFTLPAMLPADAPALRHLSGPRLLYEPVRLNDRFSVARHARLRTLRDLDIECATVLKFNPDPDVLTRCRRREGEAADVP